MHNLYTLRGAAVRDGAAWANYIIEAISLYGNEAEVSFQSHNWPHWGKKLINEYLVDTAAVYKFINDQTLTYINQGYTSDEISNMIELPKELAKNWYTRQYYGTVAHNSKAVYQKYMGWYDANPVNLNPLEPTESAKKWVEYLGDIDQVLRMAKADYEKGEYRWVAEITNVLVYADPNNEAARLLCADSLEQLGYQSESGPWRNAYLTAALELRNGNMAANATQAKNDGSIFLGMTPEMIFDTLAIRLNKEVFATYDVCINVTVTDLGENYMLRIKNGVVLVYDDTLSYDAELSISCPKNAFLLLIQGNIDKFKGISQVKGDNEIFDLFVNNLNQLDTPFFNIVEP